MDYEGVTIEWIRGERARMTIYDDNGVPQGEPIQLYDLKTRQEMHQLMIDKGFRKRTPLEQEIMERREEQLSRLGDGGRTNSFFFGSIVGLYFVVFAVVAGIAMVLVNGRRKRTRGISLLPSVIKF